MELLERAVAQSGEEIEEDFSPVRKKQSRCIFFLKTQYQICLICFMFLIFFLQSLKEWVTSVVSEKDQSDLVTAFVSNFVNMTTRFDKCNKTL